MSPRWPSEVLAAYADVLATSGGVLLAPIVAAVVLLLVCWSGDTPLPKGVARGLLAVCAVAGLVLAIRGLSILDDANYSFRYADNWVAGHGIVFNVGERVEGYTNFLWVALLAAFSAITPFRPHWIALVLGLACFLGNVAVVARIGARLHEGRAGWLPAAACYLALHTTFVAFATTGLETMFASLLVDLGVLALIAERPRALLASAFLLLATLARPDHALFWGAGFVTFALAGPRDAAWARTLARYLLPLLPYGGYLLWKLGYYGTIVPNSFYVRAADEQHASQGLVYGLTFLLGSHAWLVGALFLGALALPTAHGPARVFRRFAAVAVPLWVAYVTWVGGDYIYGRFYVVILPLLALGAERLVHAVRARRGWGGAVLGGLFVASAYGLPLIPPREIRWGIADEPTFDDRTWRDLFDADTFLASRATFAFQEIVDQGLDLAVEGTGGFAYRTRLRVVEACGLVDPTVAERARTRGSMAGHEKCLTRDALLEQGVRLSFTRSVFTMGPSQGAPSANGRPVDQLCDLTTCINILAYDPEPMRALRERTTSIRFVDAEAYLDAYIARADTVAPAQLRTDITFFREYYFRVADDPDRLARLLAAGGTGGPIGASPDATPAGPGLDGMSGFRERLTRPTP